MRPRLVAVGMVLVLVTAACSVGAASTGTPGPGGPSLTIYGAASLKGVLERIRTAYEAAVPGTTLTIATDSSAALEVQIEQGAPADVFLSADTRNPQKLIDGGFASGSPVPFAGNQLTVIVPTGNPAGIRTPADLARAGVKVIAAGDKVPITTYATQLVDNLAAEPGYPADFAAVYAANVVSREDDAKAVVAKIELGEGDAGIVYVTDATGSANVSTVDVPASANVMATYAGVVVGSSGNVDAAEALLDWIAGADGQAILAASGFLPAP